MNFSSLLSRGFLVVSLASMPLATQAQTAAKTSEQQLAEHRSKVQQYLAQKRPDLAIPELRALVKLAPNDVDARGNLGVLLYFSGQFGEAVPELRAALAAQPGLAKIRALLGISEKRTGDMQAAASDLGTALPSLQNASDKKIHIETALTLVETDQALGRLDKAAAVVSDLRTSDPEDPQVLAVSYQIYQQAMNESLLSLAVAAPDSAQLPFIMGLRMTQTGDSDKAIVQFRKAAAIDPTLPGLHFVLAQALANATDTNLHPQAETEYQIALKQNPFDEKSWIGLADIEADKGALADAEAHYNKALALQPNDAEALTGLARVLAAQNQKPKAVELLEHAVQIDPTDITAHYRLSTLYRQQGRAEDAKQQLALYEHYKALQSQLQTAIQKMRGAPGTSEDPPPNE